MEWLGQVAKEYGLFVALVVWILYYFQKLIENNKKDYQEIIKDIKKENQERESRYIEREEKYQSLISQFADSFQKLETGFTKLNDDIEEIKNKLWKNK